VKNVEAMTQVAVTAANTAMEVRFMRSPFTKMRAREGARTPLSFLALNRADKNKKKKYYQNKIMVNIKKSR
jgi:hypothetical protein